MNIKTKEQAKQAASGLRRELKALGKGPQDLKHNDILDVLAKAFGYKGWNEWNTLLENGSAPIAAAMESTALQAPWSARYPLVNNGQFDFTAAGDAGYAYESFFDLMHGLRNHIPATAEVHSAVRVKGQKMELSWTGNTNLDWDRQATEKDENGFVMWENVHDMAPQSRLVLIPIGVVERNGGTDDFDAYSCDELAVRDQLLQEFECFIREHDQSALIAALEPDGNRQAKEPINEIESVLGFALTAKEESLLISRMRNLNQPL